MYYYTYLGLADLYEYKAINVVDKVDRSDGISECIWTVENVDKKITIITMGQHYI